MRILSPFSVKFFIFSALLGPAAVFAQDHCDGKILEVLKKYEQFQTDKLDSFRKSALGLPSTAAVIGSAEAIGKGIEAASKILLIRKIEAAYQKTILGAEGAAKLIASVPSTSTADALELFLNGTGAAPPPNFKRLAELRSEYHENLFRIANSKGPMSPSTLAEIKSRQQVILERVNSLARMESIKNNASVTEAEKILGRNIDYVTATTGPGPITDGRMTERLGDLKNDTIRNLVVEREQLISEIKDIGKKALKHPFSSSLSEQSLVGPAIFVGDPTVAAVHSRWLNAIGAKDPEFGELLELKSRLKFFIAENPIYSRNPQLLSAPPADALKYIEKAARRLSKGNPSTFSDYMKFIKSGDGVNYGFVSKYASAAAIKSADSAVEGAFMIGNALDGVSATGKALLPALIRGLSITNLAQVLKALASDFRLNIAMLGIQVITTKSDNGNYRDVNTVDQYCKMVTRDPRLLLDPMSAPPFHTKEIWDQTKKKWTNVNLDSDQNPARMKTYCTLAESNPACFAKAKTLLGFEKVPMVTQTSDSDHLVNHSISPINNLILKKLSEQSRAIRDAKETHAKTAQ